MNQLLGRVVELLIELGWNFWLPINEGNDSVLVVVEECHAFWMCLVEPLEDEQTLQVQVLLPVRVPHARLLAAEEYVTRASELCAKGAFILHRDSHTVRCRHSLDLADQFLTTERLRQLVKGAAASADQHLPALMRVLTCAVRPVDALDLVVRYPIEPVIQRANEMLGE